MTLTFISPVSDQQGMKILNKYLTVLRKRFGTFMYVWVAEHQPGTRNIHFHVIQNRKFPVSYINALWVMQQYNAGLRNEKISYENLISIYNSNQFKQVHKFLNPVDIKPVHSISGLSGYLTQYVTKNNDVFGCAVWHCNRGVSSLFTSALITEKEFQETCDENINRYTNKKTGKTYVNKTFIVTDTTTGEIRSFVNTIYNHQHFRKNLKELDQLNSIVAELYYRKQVMNRELLYHSQADFFQSLYNQLN